ncbi:unnamed protein product [Caenorhabditis sp. 36 PRJEB53466]|nr:unnamed protein product [Caenorhabditis sp. 36 PRJEB53466]
MGEQSRDSEAEEAAVSFHPFVRTSVEYDANARLQMADEIASSRRLNISSALKEIITNPEVFFHQCQQSAKMAEDAHQRRHMSYNTKREAYIEQKRAEGMPLPSKIPMIEINPTRVTLSLEFESQYYTLMTNDYGNHENVASIMSQTNTLIQLPDSSENTFPDPFVQQVTLTGLYNDVDRARKLMRENSHVSVTLSLSEMTIPISDLKMFVGHNLIPNVELTFMDASLEKTGSSVYHLRFTSRAKNEKDLIKVATEVSEKVFEGGELLQNQFSLHFTLSTFHVEHVVGLSSTTLLMPEIEKHTKTTITYPKFNTRDDINDNIFVIRIEGSVKNVLKARRCIMDLLPISLCFNMKNTDMAAECGRTDRCVYAMIDGRTMLKMTPSVYEPIELLAEEVPLHCASLRSKEFNIKHLYAAYQKVLAKKNDVVAPQPDDYDNSIWHQLLPSSFYTFNMPCRGEASSDSAGGRRNRSASLTSMSKRSGKDKRFSDSAGGYHRYNQRGSSTSESAATPLLNMQPPMFAPMSAPAAHFFYFQNQQQQQAMAAAMLKGATGFPNGAPALFLHPAPYFVDPLATFVRPEYLASLPPEAFYSSPPLLPPGLPLTDVDLPMGRADCSLRQYHNQRKSTKILRAQPVHLTHQTATSGSRAPRLYEQVKEDDGRSSTRSASRRTSISGDDPIVGSFDDKSYERPFQRQYQKFSKEDQMRWRSGSRGDITRRGGLPMPDYRGTHEFHVGSAGSAEYPTPEQMQFQMTHHLKLKSADIDLEHERLFTHDTSQVEEPMYSPSPVNELMDGDFVQRLFSSASLNSPFEAGRRSRTTSCSVDRDEQTARFTDSDCGYSLAEQMGPLHSRSSIENFKKLPMVGVTKTMLEPRCRADRAYGKISLEHRGKYSFNEQQMDGEKFPENGSSLLGTRQFRIDPMKLIASVHESSEQLPRIHERQFSDVLNDKEREMAAASLKDLNLETPSVQEPSFEESSSMDYAFRSEQSSENLQ